MKTLTGEAGDHQEAGAAGLAVLRRKEGHAANRGGEVVTSQWVWRGQGGQGGEEEGQERPAEGGEWGWGKVRSV